MSGQGDPSLGPSTPRTEPQTGRGGAAPRPAAQPAPTQSASPAASPALPGSSLPPRGNTGAFELHEFMPFLMARVGALMALSFAPQLQRAGITMHMWRVMMVLYFNGPQTLIDISRATGVKTSTLSRLVGRMIERRLVSRTRSKRDARTVEVRLQRRGEALFGELWPEAARMEDLVTEPFADADLDRLKAMLREIEAILVRQATASGAR